MVIPQILNGFIDVKSDLSQLKEKYSKNDLKDMYANTAFKIDLAPSKNYTQEQIDIIDLQEKVEKLEARIEELEKGR